MQSTQCNLQGDARRNLVTNHPSLRREFEQSPASQLGIERFVETVAHQIRREHEQGQQHLLQLDDHVGQRQRGTRELQRPDQRPSGGRSLT